MDQPLDTKTTYLCALAATAIIRPQFDVIGGGAAGLVSLHRNSRQGEGQLVEADKWWRLSEFRLRTE